jgi:heme/copper-type cytochrome/quinol oxidase subunit 4
MHRLDHASYILCVILLCTVFMLVMTTESLCACRVAGTSVEGLQLIQQHSDVPERYCTFSIAIVLTILPLEH